MKQERLLKIILAPHISEKSAMIAEKAEKQFVFKVLPDATKLEVKKAVEQLFKDVTVKSVNILNKKPKTTQFRQIDGSKKGWKKAYVTLASGDINFSGLE